MNSNLQTFLTTCTFSAWLQAWKAACWQIFHCKAQQPSEVLSAKFCLNAILKVIQFHTKETYDATDDNMWP